MADLAVTTAGRVNVVGFPLVQRTLNANEDIAAGDAVRIIPSSTGAAQFTKANASASHRCRSERRGIAVRTCHAHR
jgi:hypothetical protein